MITIVNAHPGMHRAGIAHTAVATYPADRFSPGDLLILVREPAFTVVHGAVVTEAEVLAMISSRSAPGPTPGSAPASTEQPGTSQAVAAGETHAPPGQTSGSAPPAGEGKPAGGKKGAKG